MPHSLQIVIIFPGPPSPALLNMISLLISWLGRSKEKGIYFIVIKRCIGTSSRIEGKQSLIGSIYSADLTPQRTILIECTPIVCIRRFKSYCISNISRALDLKLVSLSLTHTHKHTLSVLSNNSGLLIQINCNRTEYLC